MLEVRAVGPFFKNGFVVGCPETREAILIDPGDEVEDLLWRWRKSASCRSGTSC